MSPPATLINTAVLLTDGFVTKAHADSAAPALLKALGGWPDAEWFCPSVLYDDEVVGFTLPKLQRGRKQSFRVVERSAAAQAKDQPAKAARTLPRLVAPGIADLIDEAGATNAAAFRRATFLFESAPVLYFARMPLSRFKIRAANTLRAALIGCGFRGCSLHIDGTHVIAMFWPSLETEITDYIGDARPPYPIHLDFEAGQHDGAARGQGPGLPRAGNDAERARLRRTNTKLLQEITALRTQVDNLRQSQSALGAMDSLGLDDARLKSMLRLLHPDKHGNDEAANEAAKWINNLRDLLKASRS